jgi:hypothetical protein
MSGRPRGTAHSRFYPLPSRGRRPATPGPGNWRVCVGLFASEGVQPDTNRGNTTSLRTLWIVMGHLAGTPSRRENLPQSSESPQPSQPSRLKPMARQPGGIPCQNQCRGPEPPHRTPQRRGRRLVARPATRRPASRLATRQPASSLATSRPASRRATRRPAPPRDPALPRPPALPRRPALAQRRHRLAHRYHRLAPRYHRPAQRRPRRHRPAHRYHRPAQRYHSPTPAIPARTPARLVSPLTPVRAPPGAAWAPSSPLPARARRPAEAPPPA